MKRREFLGGSAFLGLLAGCSSMAHPVAALSGSSSQKAAETGNAVANNPLMPPAHGKIPVAFVVSRGTVMIDVAGPWEVFNNVMIMSRGSSMDDQMPFQTYTVAESRQAVTLGGIRIIPDYDFANVPTPKIVVIPAQGGQTEAMLNWIRKAAKTTDVTMSVCTGAFVLASTGLLAGKPATTHHSSYKNFAAQFPDIRVQRGARFVEVGNIATAGGLTSGIDLALHIVERYFGRNAAEETAYMVWNIREPAGPTPPATRSTSMPLYRAMAISFARFATWKWIRRPHRSLSIRGGRIISARRTTSTYSILHQRNGSNGKERMFVAAVPRRILLLAAPDSQILDLVGPFQVFTRAAEILARSHPNEPPLYSIEVVTTERGMVLTSCGLRLQAHCTFRQVRGTVDTLLIVGGSCVEAGKEDAAVVEWLQNVASRLRRVGSICTGAFLLARAGLLNGRRATTHWKYCDLLARQYPAVKIEPDPIFLRDGNVYTSAGVTAGMDMALALVEEDAGSELALQVARELVLYLRRPGGQSQFSAALNLQAGDRQPFRDLVAWILEHLRSDLSVEVLASRVGMSSRNFARVFRAEMKTSPAKFIECLRLEAARRRLQESNASLESVAENCGFGNCDAMRSSFRRVLRVAPGEYRWRFQTKPRRNRAKRTPLQQDTRS